MFSRSLRKKKKQIRRSSERRIKGAIVSIAAVKRIGNAWNIGK